MTADKVSETIWITGATSGIGLALARQYAASGNRVIASGRNADALESLRVEHGIEGLLLDVTAEDAGQQVSEELRERVDYLDRIILNAGTCEYFDVERPDWEMMERIMAVNYSGALKCLQGSLPLLRQHQVARGHLVAVGSQASRAAFPRAQAYGASKAALTYFMEAMAVDLADSSIDVTIVQPGFVDTPLTQKNDFDMPFIMEPERAAQLIFEKLHKRPLYLRFPMPMNAVLGFAEKHPGWWIRHVARRLSRA